MNDQKTTVKIFVAGSCGPCKVVKKFLKQGKVNISNFEMIDVETEQGFPMIESMKLSRVPAAYIGDTQCNLSFSKDGQGIVVECPNEEK